MDVQSCKEGDCGPLGVVLGERHALDLFRALADPSRGAILASLADARRPLRVSEIGTCCPQDLSVVSRHLAVLRDAGIVESERRGREVLYRMKTEGLVRYLRELADAFESCCPPEEEGEDHGAE